MSIKVDTASLRELSSYAKAISASVDSCATSVRNARNSLPSKVLNKKGIGYGLNSACDEIDAVKDRITKISSFLSQAADLYSQTELSLNSSASEASKSTTGGPASEGIKIGSKANEVLEKMGYLGNVLAFFTKPFANWIDSGTFQVGVTGASSVTSLIKDGNSTLKGLYEWSKSNKDLDRLARMLPERAQKVRIKRLFGLDDMFAGSASQASSWSTSFKRNFKKYYKKKSPFESYTSGGAKAAFAWAELGLTAVSKTISNIDEHKSGKISAERAVAETITETAIDVGKEWLIRAVVAAGTAATVGSAPVLFVGAMTVGVSVGLDWACKKITGAVCGEEKEFTETVSDFVLNVGEAAISVGKKAVTSVVSSVKTGWSSLKSSFKRGFSPLFST